MRIVAAEEATQNRDSYRGCRKSSLMVGAASGGGARAGRLAKMFVRGVMQEGESKTRRAAADEMLFICWRMWERQAKGNRVACVVPSAKDSLVVLGCKGRASRSDRVEWMAPFRKAACG